MMMMMMMMMMIIPIKTYHRNLAVAFSDYKKAHDKVHYDWMLRV